MPLTILIVINVGILTSKRCTARELINNVNFNFQERMPIRSHIIDCFSCMH